MDPGYACWGGMWIFPVIMPITMLIIFMVFIYPGFRRAGFPCSPWHSSSGTLPPDSSATETALDILKKRYARGEITLAEFEQMRRDVV